MLEYVGGGRYKLLMNQKVYPSRAEAEKARRDLLAKKNYRVKPPEPAKKPGRPRKTAKE